MPVKPLRLCRHIGCSQLVANTYCDEHAKLKQQQQDAKRGSAYKRGYDSKWQKARVAYLARHVLCEICKAKGITKIANVVDHIKPHRGNKQLFWDVNNWQALCKKCHDIKTVTEDGGFGKG